MDVNMTAFRMGNALRAYLAGRGAQKAVVPYLTFASAEPFTIGVYNAKKNWDGTLYYSTDTASWNEWDGTTAIASAEHDGEQNIYMRGRNNSVIIGNSYRNAWLLTGSDIRCSGNIESLLDYSVVENGEHPLMGDYCYANMFYECDNIIEPPSLPAITLTYCCYHNMFYGCTNLQTTPELPATEMASSCYSNMFTYCTSLTVSPKLQATALAGYCYHMMFYGCTNLVSLPALPATVLATGCYHGMFADCTNIKLSETQVSEYTTEYRMPTEGDGVTASYALNSMFAGTGGTFTGTPEINTTYYLHEDNSIV